MSAYLENMNISRGHALASTALILSVLAILFAVSMRSTPCASAASGSCSVGETETFAGDLGLGKDADIEYEGATENDFETTLPVTDPTADRTITLPDATGTLALASVGALAVSDGGTGQTTLAADGVLVGNGTGGITVTATGNAGEVLTSNGAGSDPTFQAGPSGGLSVAEEWRVTADVTITAGSGQVVTGWELNDTTGAGSLGAGISETTGVFTFPSTGIWLIQASFNFTAGYGEYEMAIDSTRDNGVAWTGMTYAKDGAGGTTTGDSHASSYLIYDVTDTANHKLRFAVGGNYSQGTLKGDTNVSESSVVFLRLGDT